MRTFNSILKTWGHLQYKELSFCPVWPEATARPMSQCQVTNEGEWIECQGCVSPCHCCLWGLLLHKNELLKGWLARDIHDPEAASQNRLKTLMPKIYFAYMFWQWRNKGEERLSLPTICILCLLWHFSQVIWCIILKVLWCFFSSLLLHCIHFFFFLDST